MQHAGAFQRSIPLDPPREEWERLPWLFDEPKRVRRRPAEWMLALLILLVSIDAVGSYQAGRMSVMDGWPIPDVNLGHRPQETAQRLMSAEDTRFLAQRISSQRTFGWYRRRPNAAD